MRRPTCSDLQGHLREHLRALAADEGERHQARILEGLGRALPPPSPRLPAGGSGNGGSVSVTARQGAGWRPTAGRGEVMYGGLGEAPEGNVPFVLQTQSRAVYLFTYSRGEPAGPLCRGGGKLRQREGEAGDLLTCVPRVQLCHWLPWGARPRWPSRRVTPFSGSPLPAPAPGLCCDFEIPGSHTPHSAHSLLASSNCVDIGKCELPDGMFGERPSVPTGSL